MGSITPILEPLSQLVPSVSKPNYRVNHTQKTVFTAIALFIYLVCSQIPLYGIVRSYASDPFYWTRVILASNRGSLMELGISPIISASWIIAIFSGTGLLRVNSKKDERILGGF